ncbi:MAG: glycosyltransferase family 4 protein [Hyphomicrobiaceae bacterium]
MDHTSLETNSSAFGTEPPTILQIVPRLDTGGAELSAIEITQALVQAGARAIVATEGGRLAGRISELGGELLIMSAASKNPVRMAANAVHLAKIVKREGVCLLHARSRAPAWSARWAAQRCAIPFVTTYHGAYAENGAAKRLYNSVMARADRVIANSQYTADLIKQRYATPTERIRVIHRGVDPATFDPDAISPERIAALRRAWTVAPNEVVILQPARLTAWKGQRVLIEAAGKLVRAGTLASPIKVVLAGDDQGRTGYANDLARLASGLGLGDRVHFAGHVTDMPAAFAAAHVAVVASIEPEAFGRTAAESQAMQCPVIATRLGAPPETVVDANRVGLEAATGWLVPPGDPVALAGALTTALSLDSTARQALGIRARGHVAARFTVRAMQKSTLAVYDELLHTSLSAAFSRADEK